MTTRNFGGQPKPETSLREDIVAIGVTLDHDAAGPLLLEFDRLGCRWSSNSGACAPERAWRAGYAGHAGRNASLHGSCDVGHSTSAGSLAGRRARTSPNLRSPDNSHGKRCHLRGVPYVAGHSAEQSSGGVRLRHVVSRHPLLRANIPWRSRKVGVARSRSCTTSIAGCCFSEWDSTGVRLCTSLSRWSTSGESKTQRFPALDNGRTCVDGSAECRR